MYFELLVGILVFYFGFLLVNKSWKSKQRYPNGPFSLPIVGCLPFLGKAPHKKITEWGLKYGKLFSVQFGSFNVVVINDFNLIKESLKQEVYSGRPADQMLMLSLIPKGIAYNEGQECQEMRRFALKNLRDFGWGKKSMSSMMLEEVEGIVQFFKGQVGKPIELKKTFDIAVLNSVVYLVAGERYSLDDPKALEMNKIGQEAFMEPAVAGTVYFLPWIAKIFPEWSKLKITRTGVSFYHGFFTKIYNQHKKTFDPNNLRDLVDCYIVKEMENNTSQNNSSYYKGENGFLNYVNLMMNLFIAGSDTNSVTICWTIIYLLNYPEIMKKVQNEIDTVIGRSRLPTGEDRPKLPYTEAMFWEVMRLSSIAPGAILHSTMEDTELGGYHLPKRTILMPNLWHVHHDPEYWPDAESFRPERFLTLDGKFKKDERLIPFSIGKRVCIAESLAQNTVFMFISGLLQNFDFSVPTGEKMPGFEALYGLVLSPLPFKVQLNLRS